MTGADIEKTVKDAKRTARQEKRGSPSMISEARLSKKTPGRQISNSVPVFTRHHTSSLTSFIMGPMTFSRRLLWSARVPAPPYVRSWLLAPGPTTNTAKCWRLF